MRASRAKNEIDACLVRRLIARPQVSDLFGLAGRTWLSELELPAEERETVDSCMRQIEFLEQEIEEVERLIALDALDSPAVRRLMSVPAVNESGEADRLLACDPVVTGVGAE